MLIRRRLPGDRPDTIEAEQAEFRAKPKITVGRLGNRSDDAFGKALADLPRRVRVLADVQRRIQRERARARGEQEAGKYSSPRQGHVSS